VGDVRARAIHNFRTTENIFLLRAPPPHTPDIDDLRLQVLSSLSLDWMDANTGDWTLLCASRSHWRHNFSRNGAGSGNLYSLRLVSEGCC
jgi:hypothetical protein